MGEGLTGTTFALAAIIEESGWTIETALLGLAGVALTFGLWWAYDVMPSGELLAARSRRSFTWGYGHIVLFGAIIAIGGGLHAAAFSLQGESTLSAVGTVLTVAVPVAVYVGTFYALFAVLSRAHDRFHLVLVGVSAVVVLASVALAVAGVPLVWCLLVLAATPWVTVVGHAWVGRTASGATVARGDVDA